MKILFVSKEAHLLPLYKRVNDEGHDVDIYIHNKRLKHLSNVDMRLVTRSGKPIMYQVDNIGESGYDFVVFDDCLFGKLSSALMKKGVKCIGSDLWSSLLEKDEEYMISVMKSVDLPNHLVDDGFQVRCEMWWNGVSSHLHNISFVERRMMNDDLGTTCDCSGVLLKLVDKDCKLMRETVGRLVGVLKKVKYVGPVSVLSVIDKRKIDCLGVRAGFLFDNTSTLLFTLRGSKAQLLNSLCVGVQEWGSFLNDFLISVKLTLPPYPLRSSSTPPGTPIHGINDKNRKFFWFKSTSSVDGSLICDGDEEVGCATAYGRDIREAQRRVYKTLRNIHIDDVQYRTDVANKVKGIKGSGYFDKLKKYSWI